MPLKIYFSISLDIEKKVIQIVLNKKMKTKPIIVPQYLEKKSIMHVCKNRGKNKSSSLSFIDLVSNLLRNEAKHIDLVQMIR